VITMSRRPEDPAPGRGPPVPQAGDWPVNQDIASLGQTVAGRLFTAGLDLHFALMLLDDGPAAQRCAKALDELDHAIRQVRYLVLAAQELSSDGRSTAGSQQPRALKRGERG
jgi:hypothetical protein